MCSFQMYVSTQGKVAGAIRFSRPLLGFPSVTVLDAILARFLLNVFLNVVEFVFLITWILTYYHLHIFPDFPAILMSFAMASALGLGVGSLNAVLFLASPTYESVWSILTRPMMIVSGVMFLASSLPANVFAYMWWNPLIHVTGMMRHAFYPTYDASYVNPAYVFLIAGICFMLGLIGLHRFVFDALDK
jgi:capsular polysaccharide transport system permease protein